MKYCKYCGSQIEDDSKFCEHCGKRIESVETKYDSERTDGYYQDKSYYGNTSNNTSNTVDAESVGYAVLGFFIPLVGLILYLIWRNELPLRAKSCGKGALIGVIVSLILSCIYSLLIGALASFFGSSLY